MLAAMTPRTKADLIAALRLEREALEQVLQRLPSDPPAAAASSAQTLADTMAQSALWTARAVTLLFQAGRSTAVRLPKHSDEADAREVVAQRERPLAQLQADFQAAHAQLLKRLEAWSDEPALFNPRRFPGLKEQSLAACVWAWVGARDAEHRARLEKLIST